MHLFIISGFLIYICSLPSAFPCPSGCTCDGDRREVLCLSSTGTKLQRIPAPPDIPWDTVTLRISYQNISRIRRGDLAELQSLTTLHVHNSNVQVIEDRAFRNLTNLYQLSIQNNAVSRIAVTEHTFEGLSRVSHLYLSNNPGLAMEPRSLSWLDNLCCLYVMNTNVTVKLDLFTSDTDPVSSDLPRLKIIYCEDIDGEFLLKMPLMVTLSIAYPSQSLLRGYNVSSLELLGGLLLEGLSFFPREFLIHDSLRALSIAYSPFTHLPPYAYGDISSVELITIRDCGLMYVHRNSFSGLSSLTMLTLAANKLHTLPGGLFADFTLPLHQLRLSGNPWNCNCSLVWLFDFVNKNITEYHVSLDGRCQYPATLRNLLIGEIDKDTIPPCDPIQPTPPADMESTTPLSSPVSEPGFTSARPALATTPALTTVAASPSDHDYSESTSGERLSSIGTMSTQVTGPRSTPLTDSPAAGPMIPPTPSTGGADNGSGFLDNWPFVTLALCFVVIVLTTGGFVICWVRASRKDSRRKRCLPSHPTNRDVIQMSGQTPSADGTDGGQYNYATVGDTGADRRQLPATDEHSGGGDVGRVAASDHVTDDYARDTDGGRLEYDRQILNSSQGPHANEYARKIDAYDSDYDRRIINTNADH